MVIDERYAHFLFEMIAKFDVQDGNFKIIARFLGPKSLIALKPILIITSADLVATIHSDIIDFFLVSVFAQNDPTGCCGEERMLQQLFVRPSVPFLE